MNIQFFPTSWNINNNEYINIQIILCDNFIDQKSHIQVFNQNNKEIFFSNIVVSGQVTLELISYINITIIGTSHICLFNTNIPIFIDI